jgi:hypothetical protein
MSAGAATPAFDMETRKHMNRLRACVGQRTENVGTYSLTVKAVRSLEADVAKLGTIDLKGASGASWTFDVYPRETTFRALGSGLRAVGAHAKGGRRREPSVHLRRSDW